MAEYKVPQDVEADDKLLGPFTFRQLIYLFITGGLIALAVFLFQIFPLLTIIPLPFIFFFAVLALPLKKDQPMETYLAAIVSFHLKSKKRLWNPGQRESTILITAPKIIEKIRTKNISEEEASHRLSFLANIADSEGYAIHDSNLNDTYAAEAEATPDIFDTMPKHIDEALAQETTSRHDDAVNRMRNAIEQAENPDNAPPEIHKYSDHYQYQPEEHSSDLPEATNTPIEAASNSSVIVQPDLSTDKPSREPLNTINNEPPEPPQSPTDFIKTRSNDSMEEAETSEESENPEPKPELVDLANNSDFKIDTISSIAANRENNKKDDEVYISLH